MTISYNLKKPLSIYIHWPFCKKKCPYCDFNSHVRKEVNERSWLDGFLKEIDYFKNFISSRRIETIFFGGGTPSLMPTFIPDRIIEHLNKISPFNGGIEISLEANPTSSEASKFRDLHNAGINRLSIGVQSLRDEYLKFLGREHSAKEAIEVINIAANIFSNYSIDLIYSRPDQSMESWKQELSEIIQLARNHISLYQLTIEKGTPFYKMHKEKQFQIPDQDLALELYSFTNDTLSESGFKRYEISNYAKNGYKCLHNINYWKYNEYLGIGPGAHSRVVLGKNKEMHAVMMMHNPEKWLNSVMSNGHGIQSNKEIAMKDLATEYILMGARHENGIDTMGFQNRFGVRLIQFIDEQKLDFCINHELILKSEIHKPSNAIILSDKGKTLLNYVVSEIII